MRATPHVGGVAGSSAAFRIVAWRGTAPRAGELAVSPNRRATQRPRKTMQPTNTVISNLLSQAEG